MYMHTDIDECALGISGCNQICTNTIGSYVCSCFLGYHISSNNKTCVGKHLTSIIVCYIVRSCAMYMHTDIDECALGISGCNQICTNTIGSYMCNCYPGYQISSDHSTCVGK